jgi:cyclopropane-fatty-acyl-phospholipid synthase
MLHDLRHPFGFVGSAMRRRSASLGPPRAMQSPASALDRWCLGRLAEMASGVALRLVLWDGTTLASSAGPERFTLRIADRQTLWRIAREPDLGFGEGYMNGRLEVDGDFAALVDAVAHALAGRRRRMSPVSRWLASLAGASVRGARRNAHHHYDLGNDFYRQWLDDDLVYTCAYFPTPDATLDVAQQAKLDYVCRKLDLAPGLRVFEAGCGWGALARHMARAHGTTVRAWNVSAEQVREARARADAEGLTDRVTFIEDDWRRIDGTCDVFVSVGMLEHVGPSRYRELGRVIDRCLDREHGRGLLHFIGRDTVSTRSRWTARHIFPGFYLPTLREVLARVLEPHGFSVVDVENLRGHYALTLGHWQARFERAAPLVTTQLGERFTRMWRYYLAGAHAGFAAGYLQLFQVTFARETPDPAPTTRAHWY